jgi:hypothetical protein
MTMRSIFQKTRHDGRRRLRRLPVVVVLLLLANAVNAQTDGVDPGDKVRFRTAPSESFHGATVARITKDSLFLESCTTCERLVYARADVNHLDVFRIRDRGDRALLGILIGAVAGGVIGLFISKSCRGNVDACELSVLAIPGGALLGGFFGGIAGFLSGYSWQPVATDGS